MILNYCLRTFIFLWPVFLYRSDTILKILLTWFCSCMKFQHFACKIVIFCPNFRDDTWRCSYFGAKLVFKARIFLKMYPWFMKIYIWFQIYILSMIAWKAPASSWSPLQLSMFLKIDPRYFGPFGKIQDTKEIFM